ncbi:MAG: right-handed parallel beta-helix repeat-containing protein [Bacteroidales bacterium]|nr:right-handed parallel beta-helix repeat-containing protein [Bacteroidales bacterium]
MKKLIMIPLLMTGIHAHPALITVDPSGGGSCTTIQAGIGMAVNGDTVLVMPGTYSEIVDFSGKDILLCSRYLLTGDTTYIDQTVIDGLNQNSRLVRFTNGESQAARIAGFTIRNGAPPPGEVEGGAANGLGIYVENSSPVIERNHIKNNSFWLNQYGIGGGIAVSGGSPQIISNEIYSNNYAFEGGGIYIYNGNDILISGNIIHHHPIFSGLGYATGAGVCIRNSTDIIISGNHVYNNGGAYCCGGGIGLAGCARVLCTANRVEMNECTDDGEGGGLNLESCQDIWLISNLVASNHAEGMGGGISLMYYTDALMVNNTVCFNTTGSMQYGEGGGLYFVNSFAETVNTIIYANTAGGAGDQVYLSGDDSDPDFSYCDIEGGWQAFGLGMGVNYNGSYTMNIDLDPEFVMTGEHPFSIGETSPCVNSGNPDTTGLMLPEKDLAGVDRIVNDTVDIGAYEHPLQTGIQHTSDDPYFSVFPNPCGRILHITLPHGIPDTHIVIFDMAGCRVMYRHASAGETTLYLDGIPPGVYVVSMESDGEFRQQKILKR